MDLDFKTISIGFSKTVSIALIGFTRDDWLSAVRGLSLSVSVISANGVPWRFEGPGDTEGCGVGRGGGSSDADDTLDPLIGILFLLCGDSILVEASGPCSSLSPVSKICEGSTFSFATLFLRPPARVVASKFVVFLLDCVDFRGLRFGATAKSSSLSSFTFDCTCSSSSSDSTTFLLEAVRLEDLVGNVDILVIGYGLVVWVACSEAAVRRSRIVVDTRGAAVEKFCIC